MFCKATINLYKCFTFNYLTVIQFQLAEKFDFEKFRGKTRNNFLEILYFFKFVLNTLN